ncbi:N-acetyltransferase [Oerskovia paurometabola]|uniref:hypothetical protein n=1 Tax=Oerskovia paurometabola TaxID=162170 RepID=UPI00382D79F2
MRAFAPQPIDDAHEVSQFCCGGEESLDRYLQNEAKSAHQRGAARTHVWLDEQKVSAYYTVVPQTITPRLLPRTVKTGFNAGIPGFTIVKLALDQGLRGRSLGNDLLIDALSTIVGAADLVGGRVIMVEAADNPAFAFYERAGFKGIDASYEMWMLVDTARAALRG